MKEFLEELFSSSFMPHGHCYLWNPGLIWLHVVSDSLIALAYFFIPVALIYRHDRWLLVNENEPGAPPVWHSRWPKLHTRPKRPPRGWRERRHISRIPCNLRHRQCPAYRLGTGRCGLRPCLETLTHNS
jgi:hypothetical protein